MAHQPLKFNVATSWFRRIVGIAYLCLLIFLSLAPPILFAGVPLFPGIDKVVHFLMYFTLSIIVCWNLPDIQMDLRALAAIATGGFLFGFAMEVLQLVLRGGRAFEFSDVIANTLGGLGGVVGYRVLFWKRSLNDSLSEPKANAD